jgi:hypothetical protein
MSNERRIKEGERERAATGWAMSWDEAERRILGACRRRRRQRWRSASNGQFDVHHSGRLVSILVFCSWIDIFLFLPILLALTLYTIKLCAFASTTTMSSDSSRVVEATNNDVFNGNYPLPDCAIDPAE